MTKIAIVGMGCRFPGASDLAAYWRMTQAGEDGFSSVPADRWDHALFMSESRRAADKSYAPRGGFVDDVTSFPALELGIPPRRVQVMDPQQRLLLWTALEAIEDAGMRPSDLPARTGVVVGVTATEFRELQTARSMAQLMASGHLGTPPEDPAAFSKAVDRVLPPRAYTAPGGLANMAAAMVAQELDLKGPAYTVDSACASALVALAQAIDGLRAGSLDAALAGGVYLNLAPDHFIAFSRVGAMSQNGRCLPFDARADGFVQGEGAGVVLIKRLDDALAAGDRIYAVIDGVALNSDGSGDGPMAPNVDGQADVIRRAWEDAGRSPSELGYVECHGTATPVGDPTEIQGLVHALGSSLGSHEAEVVIGSSKANIGHTMSAAGVAGLIRAALAVHHGKRPPMAGFESPNPKLDFAGTPFVIPTEAMSWGAASRVACVSSFGFGGTNAHVVVSNASPDPVQTVEQFELITLSAGSIDQLQSVAAATAEAVAADPSLEPAAVARAWASRRRLKARAGLVVRGRQDLTNKLQQLAAGDIPAGSHLAMAADEAPRIAFLYPGQGAQRTGMLTDIRDRFPQVRETLDRLDEALTGVLPTSLNALIYPEEPGAAATERLTQTSHCQPALLACGVALTDLLADMGIRPVVAAGHSLGEFTAATAAGVLSPEAAAQFVARRGLAMEALGGDPGAMAAFKTSAERARELLGDRTDVVIANVNHPGQCVVSGLTEAVAEVVQRAEKAGVEAIALSVSHGFHSPALAGLDVGELVNGLEISPLAGDGPQLASAIDGALYRDDNHARDIFARHALSPVHFIDALEVCEAQDVDIYLQVASGGPMAAFARNTLKGRGKTILSLAPMVDDDGGEALLSVLARLWTLGVDMDVRSIAGAAPIGATLPASLLPTERYWVIQEGPGRAPTLEKGTVTVPKVLDASAAPSSIAAHQTKPPSDGDDNVAQRVMAVVSKVSAYPLEALKPSMTLMGSLGFDSIMVADLAAGLTEAFDNVDGIPQELMLNNPTVADVIEFARTAVPGASADAEGPLTRWSSSWEPRRRFALQRLTEAKHALIIGGTHEPLAAALIGRGMTVSVCPLGDADQASAADLIVCLADMAEPKPLGAILSGEVAWPDRSGALIAALDAAAARGGSPDLVVWRRSDDPWAEGLAAVARVVAREWPDVTSKCIYGGTAEDLIAEWASADRTVDVRFDNGQRETLIWREDLAPAGNEPGTWSPSTSDTVVITGGTRGIGAKLGARLCAQGAKVVLLGRGEPDPDVRDMLEASGGRWVAAQADVTDLSQVKAAVAPHAPITALVHAAGVLADGPLGTVDPETGHLARQVKARGLLNGVSACGKSLKVVLGVGSWAGRFGNRHQAHYAAGNALMAALAERPANGMRLAVAEFGPWAESSMVQSIPQPVQQAMKAEGIDFISDEEGLEAIITDLTNASGTVVHARRRPSVRRTDASISFSVATHPFLEDHAIDGVPVLPLAAAADLLAWSGGADAADHGAFELTDLQLFKGIALPEAGAVLPVRVSADGGKVELRQGHDDTLSYRARLAPFEGPLDAPARVTGGEPPTLSLEAFYERVTFHGPLLQGAVRIDGIGEGFVRGVVRTGRPDAWEPETQRRHFAIDPLAFDSAMQLAAHVAWTRFQRAGTPVSLGRFVQLAPWPDEVTTEVLFGEMSADSDRFSATIAFYDGGDTLVALAEDVVAELRQVAVDATEAPAEQEPPAFEIKPQWVDPSRWREVKDMAMRLKMADAIGVGNPYFHVHEGTARDTTVVDGRELVNFSSYNYLGLSGDARVLADVKEAVDTFGTSVSASRVASGERPFHGELEKLLARCQDVDDSVLFTAGHAANVSTIGHILGPKDLILHDELIHDSALGGIKMSGANRRGFKHEDHDDLEAQLRELRPHYEKCLIISEGVYSMDGDICDLPSLVAIKKRHGCLLMIDEAHSFGIVGETGCGLREHWGVAGREVDLWMGTLSKSLASCGGWIAGSQTLIDYLRYSVGGFVYSAGMTPANGVAALSSLKLMLEEPERVRKLQTNAAFFHAECVRHGLDTGPARGGSGVIPVITGNSIHALFLSKYLSEKGINVQPIVFPAVADDAARLRFFLSSSHSEEQLAWTAETVARTLEETRSKHPVKKGRGSI